MFHSIFIFPKCRGAVETFPTVNLAKISETEAIIGEKLVTLQSYTRRNDNERGTDPGDHRIKTI